MQSRWNYPRPSIARAVTAVVVIVSGAVFGAALWPSMADENGVVDRRSVLEEFDTDSRRNRQYDMRDSQVLDVDLFESVRGFDSAREFLRATGLPARIRDGRTGIVFRYVVGPGSLSDADRREVLRRIPHAIAPDYSVDRFRGVFIAESECPPSPAFDLPGRSSTAGALGVKDVERQLSEFGMRLPTAYEWAWAAAADDVIAMEEKEIVVLENRFGTVSVWGLEGCFGGLPEIIAGQPREFSDYVGAYGAYRSAIEEAGDFGMVLLGGWGPQGRGLVSNMPFLVQPAPLRKGRWTLRPALRISDQ